MGHVTYIQLSICEQLKKLMLQQLTLLMKEQRLPLTIGISTSSLEEEDSTLIDLEK